MHQATAKTKYIRISPKKARLVADLVRGMNAEKALLQLTQINMKAGRLIKRTLLSAMANAETLYEVKKESLVISEIRVDEGPTLKRSKPKNKGGRVPIMKRTSHFKIVVEG